MQWSCEQLDLSINIKKSEVNWLQLLGTRYSLQNLKRFPALVKRPFRPRIRTLQQKKTRSTLSISGCTLSLHIWHCLECVGHLSSPQWGGGRLFGASTGFFFYENSHNSKRKVKNRSPRATNWPLTKIGVIGQKLDFEILAKN